MTLHPAIAAAPPHSNRRASGPAVPLCSLPIDQRADLFLRVPLQFATPTVQILVRRPSKSVRATQHLFASDASVFQLSFLPIDKRADLFLGGAGAICHPDRSDTCAEAIVSDDADDVRADQVEGVDGKKD